jgi:hypothetical protein
MTNPLHAVAERIGMRLMPDEDRMRQWWVDGDAVACRGEPDGAYALRRYLLTGDRPLRIKVEFGICDEYNRANRYWLAWAYSADDTRYVPSPKSDTPAEAILACAEAVCS